ncbi:MAG: chemotaxis protein CheX [Sedimentisphaerales bacterium]|nr:chemotaxis protein CheX [Sedimentisphaerales bacterium]
MGKRKEYRKEGEIEKAFESAIKKVLRIMIGVHPQFGPPRPVAAISASAPLSVQVNFSEGAVGVMVLGLDQDTAAHLTEAFCCESLEIGSADFIDAISEITNMIAGNAKRNFPQGARISRPRVRIGADLEAGPLSKRPGVHLDCWTELGDLAVEYDVRFEPEDSQEETDYEVSTCG